MRLKQREYMDLAGKYIRMERPATAEEQECGLPSLIGLETTVTEVEFLDDGGVRIRGDSFDFTLPLDEADAWKFIVWPDEDAASSEDLRQAVVDAARSHLAEVDNAPTVPEQGGTIGRLRDTLEDLDAAEEGQWTT